jgi:transposase-like protein
MNIPESPARQKWREIIRRQQSSGLGVAEFCRDNMIPPSSFFGWRRKLGHAQAAAFVEATVAPRPAGIEIRLRGGRRLLLRRGFDRELLAEAVAVLETIPRHGEPGGPA